MYGFQIDPIVYDSGFRIIIEYSRNKELSDCAENRFLDLGGIITNEFVFHAILPLVRLSDPIIHVIFKTVDGRITVNYRQSLTVTYPLLPQDTVLPVIPISSILRCDSLDHPFVDLVKIDGELYAFKHDCQLYLGTSLVYSKGKISKMDESLPMEVVHLTRFQSPFIIKPLFLVSDTVDPLRFRGYVMPLLRAGSLADVLSRLRKSKGEDTWIPPRIGSDPLISLDVLPKLIDWPTKQLWASDIARGVVVLHDANSFSGDIKLDNLLLGTDGRICLTDVYPLSTGGTINYAPPEIVDFRRMKPTAAHDVFSMGLVLWALSEELEGFWRQHVEEPHLFWKEGEGAAPEWYRKVVDSCLELDPEKRPSAQTVLGTILNLSVAVF